MGDASAVVVDASALIELLLGSPLAAHVADALAGNVAHAPAHLDAEVLSALGRLERAGELDERDVAIRLRALTDAPIRREPLAPLLGAAWARRHDTRLADGLYLALADQLGTLVVTTDARLARAHPRLARLVEP